MFTKYIVPALCVGASIQGVAGSAHRHAHMQKKNGVDAAIEVEIVTTYITVTVYAGEETSTASSSSVLSSSAPLQSTFTGGKTASETTSSSSSAIPTSTSIVVSTTSTTEVPTPTTPTTLATSTKAASSTTSTTEVPYAVSEAAVAVASSTSSSTAAAAAKAAASTTSSSTSDSSSGRGLAYNDATLVTVVTTLASSVFGWCYNWGSTSDGVISTIEYIPMLWGPADDHTSDWDTNAAAAIAAGASALLSFNEPDNAGQADLTPAVAAADHIKYMNPYSGKARISSPAITSSEDADEGTDWLDQFFTACDGNCAVDFCAAHWYGEGGEAGADLLLTYLLEVNTACQGKNVWLTEFASTSGDTSAFMTKALDQLENNSTFSFVERYSYFYLATGSLMESTTALSSYGEIYAGLA